MNRGNSNDDIGREDRRDRSIQEKGSKSMFSKMMVASGAFVVAATLFLGSGVLGESPAFAKPGDHTPTTAAQNEARCHSQNGISSRVTMPGGKVIVVCTFPDGSGWACGDFGSGYDCKSRDDQGNPLSSVASSGHSIADASSTPVRLTKADDETPIHRSVDELVAYCDASGGDPWIIWTIDGGVYVECHYVDEDGDKWGWKCGEIGPGFGYNCDDLSGDAPTPTMPFTSGFSISDNGSTKAGTVQVNGRRSGIDSSDVTARQVGLTDCGGAPQEQPGESGPGGGGIVVDPSTPPSDPMPPAPFFTSGFNIGGSQVITPVTENEPCVDGDDSDVEPPADEPVAEPTEEPQSEPTAEEPVNDGSTQDDAQRDSSNDTTPVESVTEPVSQPASQGSQSPVADRDGSQVDAPLNASAEAPEATSGSGFGLGLLLLGGVALATPAAAGALLLRRRPR